MKLTFITDEASQSPDEFLTLAHEFDLDAVELRSVFDRNVADLGPTQQHLLLSTLRDAGIGVCCIGSPVFKCDIDTPLDTELDKLKSALDAAALLESPLVRIFTYWRRADPVQYQDRVVRALTLAGELAKPYGITLTIENGKRTMHATGHELRELFRHLDATAYSVLWDPGNSIFSGLDSNPIEHGYPAIAHLVGHVHIKDPAVYCDSREYVALGNGQLDLAAQLEALSEHHYPGYISLETHWRPDRRLPETLLDYPVGVVFSSSGYEATRQSLSVLAAMMANTSRRHV